MKKMDYHNNEIGRNYADEVLSTKEIKELVLNSREIIKSPNDLK